MTDAVSIFIIAFLFSFVGTIPPGTLNLAIVQLGLRHQIAAAWRMAVTAAVIEYPYAWIAVEFQDILGRSTAFTGNLQLLSASVMILLGVLNLWSSAKPSKLAKRFEASGFRKGVVLAVLNPMAIPYWTVMTTYLQGNGWVDLSDNIRVHAYLAGVSAGTLVLFVLLAYLAQKVVSYFRTDGYLGKLPGLILILLGCYALVEYMLE